jgi:hypothetical protein
LPSSLIGSVKTTAYGEDSRCAPLGPPLTWQSLVFYRLLGSALVVVVQLHLLLLFCAAVLMAATTTTAATSAAVKMVMTIVGVVWLFFSMQPLTSEMVI